MSKKIDISKLSPEELIKGIRDGSIAQDTSRWIGSAKDIIYVGNGDEEPETTPEFQEWLANERRLIAEEKAAAEATKKPSTEN